MTTKIHITKKLESLAKKLIKSDQNLDCGILGKWNATIFYADRKKCWLITNGLTKYNVVLTDIKSIEELFKNVFYGQLVYDGIIIEFGKISEIIGK